MPNSSRESKEKWLANNQHRRAEINRKSRLRRHYGIPPEQFDEMYETQDGKCAICKGELLWQTNGLHVDHDHKTRWVRGLLCGRCNLGIGQFVDDVDLMQRAIERMDAFDEEAHTVPVPKENLSARRKGGLKDA